jgi:hypothetical protein
LLKRISGCREKIRKETPSTEPVAAATISLFSQRGIACNALSTSLQTLKSLVLCSELRSAFSPLRKTISSRLLLWAYPIRRPSARVPHLGTLPLDRSPRTTSLRAHLQRLCRVTDLHGCYQDSLSAVGAAPGAGLRWPSLVVKASGVLQMRIRLGGALNATSAGAGCAKTKQFLAKYSHFS